MTEGAKTRRIVIMGAAGRDFHNFNRVYRDDPDYQVVAFTAAQIPHIAGRLYPPALAGRLYPDGIPVVEESELERLCREACVDQVVFAYSDIGYERVMHSAAIALAGGADFVFLGPEHTMLQASVPVIAVSAVRTGCGKSQTARWLSRLLRQHGLRVALIRHPMPYGDLEQQAVQRFATPADLDAADCTIEEREEYEPHLAIGNVVYAGVDYARIVARAESECDVILWDGGNNDFPFIRPDLHVVLVDPLRPGSVTSHHPGEAVLRMADIIVVAKADAAASDDVQQVRACARAINPRATLIRGGSPLQLEQADQLQGKRVLVVEDGPTLTHGGMAYGAGFVAATRAQVGEIVDPRTRATGEIAALFSQYPHIGRVLPAVGYHPSQLQSLRDTINAIDADVVISATPCDLSALITINKPVLRVRYEYADIDQPGLGGLVEVFLRNQSLVTTG